MVAADTSLRDGTILGSKETPRSSSRTSVADLFSVPLKAETRAHLDDSCSLSAQQLAEECVVTVRYQAG